MQVSLFDVCAKKHGGNRESVASFRKIENRLPQRRQEVFDYVKSCGVNGATAQECADHLGVPIHKVSGRFSELKRDGQISKVGIRNDGGVCVAAEYASQWKEVKE